jgi:hypothetical protein
VPIVVGNISHNLGSCSLPRAFVGLRLPDLDNLRGVNGCIHIAVSDVNFAARGARDNGRNVRVNDLAGVKAYTNGRADGVVHTLDCTIAGGGFYGPRAWNERKEKPKTQPYQIKSGAPSV